jgi:ADP-heptose:LPS heptosyltransferase
MIDHLHLVDHWRLNRSRDGLWRKWRRYLEMRRTARREIETVGYDVAIDLYPFVPNSAGLLWSARIPCRVGFRSGGFGSLFTRAIPWTDDDRHVAEHHRDLLATLDGRFANLPSPRYCLPAVDEPHDRIGVRGYLLIHIGAGLQQKEWPLSCWTALVGELLERGHTLVFTGSGPRQTADIRRLADGNPRCHDLSDQLSWDEFVGAVRGARLVISVDSVTGHIAGAVGSPAVVLISGINRISTWQPLGDGVEMVTHGVPCAPCHRRRGCATMDCIRGVTVSEVLEAIDRGLVMVPNTQ